MSDSSPYSSGRGRAVRGRGAWAFVSSIGREGRCQLQDAGNVDNELSKHCALFLARKAEPSRSNLKLPRRIAKGGDAQNS